jgi:hypothetical protein
MSQLFRISLQCIHMESYNVFHNRCIRVLLAFFLGLSMMVWAAPVQAAGAKSIAASLSKQQLYAYQGKPSSTSRPSSPVAHGPGISVCRISWAWQAQDFEGGICPTGWEFITSAESKTALMARNI